MCGACLMALWGHTNLQGLLDITGIPHMGRGNETQHGSNIVPMQQPMK